MTEQAHTQLDRADALLADDPATAAERARTAEVNELGEKIVDALKTCYDPEIPVNIYELGLIYKVDVEDDNKVLVDMTLTSPNCPVAESLPIEVQDKVKGVEGVDRLRGQPGLGPALAPVDDVGGGAARARDDLLGCWITRDGERRRCRLLRRSRSVGSALLGWLAPQAADQKDPYGYRASAPACWAWTTLTASSWKPSCAICAATSRRELPGLQAVLVVISQH